MKLSYALFKAFFYLGLIMPLLSSGQDLQEETKETLVVYYFGSTSCGYCNVPANVDKVKQIKSEFIKKHPNFNTKYVLVCMDSNIEEGLKFIGKYGYWDEISIGSFYHNELALNFLNKTVIAGVPHIIVYKDNYELKEYSIPLIKERKVVVDLVGFSEITNWITSGYPLKTQ